MTVGAFQRTIEHRFQITYISESRNANVRAFTVQQVVQSFKLISEVTRMCVWVSNGCVRAPLLLKRWMTAPVMAIFHKLISMFGFIVDDGPQTVEELPNALHFYTFMTIHLFMILTSGIHSVCAARGGGECSTRQNPCPPPPFPLESLLCSLFPHLSSPISPSANCPTCLPSKGACYECSVQCTV